MVTYAEYLEYFERFKVQLTYRICEDLVIHYLVDSIIMEFFRNPTQTIHIKIDRFHILSPKRCMYMSCGNTLFENPSHKKQFHVTEFVLKQSGLWYHSLPKIDLCAIRFSTKGLSEDQSLFLFRRIYDDYRVRTRTFARYDLQIKYI